MATPLMNNDFQRKERRTKLRNQSNPYNKAQTRHGTNKQQQPSDNDEYVGSGIVNRVKQFFSFLTPSRPNRESEKIYLPPIEYVTVEADANNKSPKEQQLEQELQKTKQKLQATRRKLANTEVANQRPKPVSSTSKDVAPNPIITLSNAEDGASTNSSDSILDAIKEKAKEGISFDEYQQIVSALKQQVIEKNKLDAVTPLVKPTVSKFNQRPTTTDFVRSVISKNNHFAEPIYASPYRQAQYPASPYVSAKATHTPSPYYTTTPRTNNQKRKYDQYHDYDRTLDAIDRKLSPTSTQPNKRRRTLATSSKIRRTIPRPQSAQIRPTSAKRRTVAKPMVASKPIYVSHTAKRILQALDDLASPIIVHPKDKNAYPVFYDEATNIDVPPSNSLSYSTPVPGKKTTTKRKISVRKKQKKPQLQVNDNSISRKSRKQRKKIAGGATYSRNSNNNDNIEEEDDEVVYRDDTLEQEPDRDSIKRAFNTGDFQFSVKPTAYSSNTKSNPIEIQDNDTNDKEKDISKPKEKQQKEKQEKEKQQKEKETEQNITSFADVFKTNTPPTGTHKFVEKEPAINPNFSFDNIANNTEAETNKETTSGLTFAFGDTSDSDKPKFNFGATTEDDTKSDAATKKDDTTFGFGIGSNDTPAVSLANFGETNTSKSTTEATDSTADKPSEVSFTFGTSNEDTPSLDSKFTFGTADTPNEKEKEKPSTSSASSTASPETKPSLSTFSNFGASDDDDKTKPSAIKFGAEDDKKDGDEADKPAITFGVSADSEPVKLGLAEKPADGFKFGANDDKPSGIAFTFGSSADSTKETEKTDIGASFKFGAEETNKESETKETDEKDDEKSEPTKLSFDTSSLSSFTPKTTDTASITSSFTFGAPEDKKDDSPATTTTFTFGTDSAFTLNADKPKESEKEKEKEAKKDKPSLEATSSFTFGADSSSTVKPAITSSFAGFSTFGTGTTKEDNKEEGTVKLSSDLSSAASPFSFEALKAKPKSDSSDSNKPAVDFGTANFTFGAGESASSSSSGSINFGTDSKLDGTNPFEDSGNSASASASTFGAPSTFSFGVSATSDSDSKSMFTSPIKSTENQFSGTSKLATAANPFSFDAISDNSQSSSSSVASNDTTSSTSFNFGSFNSNSTSSSSFDTSSGMSTDSNNFGSTNSFNSNSGSSGMQFNTAGNNNNNNSSSSFSFSDAPNPFSTNTSSSDNPFNGGNNGNSGNPFPFGGDSGGNNNASASNNSGNPFAFGGGNNNSLGAGSSFGGNNNNNSNPFSGGGGGSGFGGGGSGGSGGFKKADASTLQKRNIRRIKRKKK